MCKQFDIIGSRCSKSFSLTHGPTDDPALGQDAVTVEHTNFGRVRLPRRPCRVADGVVEVPIPEAEGCAPAGLQQPCRLSE